MPPEPPLLPPAYPPPVYPDAATMQWVRDGEHLRLLSIFHYIVGGLAILFSSLFIFHVVFGIMLLHNAGPFGRPLIPSSAVSAPAPTASPAGTADKSDEPTPTPRQDYRRAGSANEPPAFLGYFLVGIGSFAVLAGWTLGALLVYSGRCLACRTRRVFSMVMGGISCVQVPFGTILGVFTLVVLQRPSVKALYAAAANGPTPELPHA